MRPAALASLGGFFAHAEAQAEAPGAVKGSEKKSKFFFFEGVISTGVIGNLEYLEMTKWAILIKQNVDNMKQSWLNYIMGMIFVFVIWNMEITRPEISKNTYCILTHAHRSMYAYTC